jgi:Nucleotidyltransferase domain
MKKNSFSRGIALLLIVLLGFNPSILIAADLEVPQGLTPEEFSWLSEMLHEGAGRLGSDIRVHGSRAEGTARLNSDIDMLFAFQRKSSTS